MKLYFYSGFLKPRPQRGVPFSTVPEQYFHGTLETELTTEKDYEEILTMIAYHKKGLGREGESREAIRAALVITALNPV